MLKLKNTFVVATLSLALASIAVAQNRPVNDYPGSVARASKVGPLVLTAKETLKATYSDSNGGAFASCSTSGCIAPPVTIYNYNLTCPANAGQSCTYDIQIAGQVESGGNSLASGEDGLYQFLVDGAAPSGGGTDQNALYAWQQFGPEFLFGTSYNVHSKVTNGFPNQKHNVAVNLSCDEIIGDSTGCFALASFQTLVVRVWTP